MYSLHLLTVASLESDRTFNLVCSVEYELSVCPKNVRERRKRCPILLQYLDLPTYLIPMSYILSIYVLISDFP